MKQHAVIYGVVFTYFFNPNNFLLEYAGYIELSRMYHICIEWFSNVQAHLAQHL